MNQLNPNLPTEKNKIKELMDYYQYRIDSTEAMTSISWRIKECKRLIGFPDVTPYDRNACEELLFRYERLLKTFEGEIAALKQQYEDLEALEKERKNRSRRRKKEVED